MVSPTDGFALKRIEALCDGDVRAVAAISQLIEARKRFDPLWESEYFFETLESTGMRGKSIWIFYRNLCLEDGKKAVAVLRLHSLQTFPLDWQWFDQDLCHAVLEALDHYRKLFLVDEAVELVKCLVPSFGVEAA